MTGRVDPTGIILPVAEGYDRGFRMSADLSRHARRVALVTACGAKKRAGTWPLHLLYQSPRIKAIYGRKGGFPLFILSAQYGLVDCEQERPSYDRLMNMQRAEELAPGVAEVMGRYDWLVFFNPQTPSEYSFCIERASDISGVPVAFIGWWPLGGLQECLGVAYPLSHGEMPDRNIRSLRLADENPTWGSRGFKARCRSSGTAWGAPRSPGS
jgi:hypothetical protein